MRCPVRSTGCPKASTDQAPAATCAAVSRASGLEAEKPAVAAGLVDAADEKALEEGWLNEADGFAPKRPIGGCPTGTPATAGPNDVERAVFKLFVADAPCAEFVGLEPIPNPLAAVASAV